MLIDAVSVNGGHLGSNLGCGRAHPRAAPGLRVAPRRHRVGHRPPDLRAQAGHRSSRRLRPAPAGRRDVGVPVTRRVGARRRREQPCVHRGQLRVRPRGRPRHHRRRRRGRRRDRRRRAHRRAGVRGAEQLRAQRPPRGDRAQRQRPLLRADRLAPHRGRQRRAIRRRSSRRSGSTTSARSTATTSPRSSRVLRDAAGAPTGRSSCTCSPARARATCPRRPTTRSASTTSARSTPRPACRSAGSGSSYTGRVQRRAHRARGRARPEIVALTAGMPGSTGLLAFAERFPDRCFDVGIAEQHAVTAAAGMAMRGLRPVVARLLHLPEPGVGPDASTTSACTRCRSCSASTGPASPATTARATTASTTSRCSPRCPG